MADVFDALVSVLRDTRLELDLNDLLRSTVNVFHRAAAQVRRQLDRNEDEQKRSQAEKDGSEVRSVELELLIAEGVTMIERRNAFEALRTVLPTSSRRNRNGLAAVRRLTATAISPRG